MIYLRLTEVVLKVPPNLVELMHQKHHWMRDQWWSWTQFNHYSHVNHSIHCSLQPQLEGAMPKPSKQLSVQSQSSSIPYCPLLINPDISTVAWPKPLAWLNVGSTRSSQASWLGRSNVVGWFPKQVKSSDSLPIGTDGGKDAVSVRSHDNRMF